MLGFLQGCPLAPTKPARHSQSVCEVLAVNLVYALAGQLTQLVALPCGAYVPRQYLYFCTSKASKLAGVPAARTCRAHMQCILALRSCSPRPASVSKC